jgi:hypothetical protein
MINEYGAVGEMRTDRANRSSRRKPTIMLLCPPQIPHDLRSNPGLRRGSQLALCRERINNYKKGIFPLSYSLSAFDDKI